MKKPRTRHHVLLSSLHHQRLWLKMLPTGLQQLDRWFEDVDTAFIESALDCIRSSGAPMLLEGILLRRPFREAR